MRRPYHRADESNSLTAMDVGTGGTKRKRAEDVQEGPIVCLPNELLVLVLCGGTGDHTDCWLPIVWRFMAAHVCRRWRTLLRECGTPASRSALNRVCDCFRACPNKSATLRAPYEGRHLWASALARLAHSAPSPASFVADFCARHLPSPLGPMHFLALMAASNTREGLARIVESAPPADRFQAQLWRFVGRRPANCFHLSGRDDTAHFCALLEVAIRADASIARHGLAPLCEELCINGAIQRAIAQDSAVIVRQLIASRVRFGSVIVTVGRYWWRSVAGFGAWNVAALLVELERSGTYASTNEWTEARQDSRWQEHALRHDDGRAIDFCQNHGLACHHSALLEYALDSGAISFCDALVRGAPPDALQRSAAMISTLLKSGRTRRPFGGLAMRWLLAQSRWFAPTTAEVPAMTALACGRWPVTALAFCYTGDWNLDSEALVRLLQEWPAETLGALGGRTGMDLVVQRSRSKACHMPRIIQVLYQLIQCHARGYHREVAAVWPTDMWADVAHDLIAEAGARCRTSCRGSGPCWCRDSEKSHCLFLPTGRGGRLQTLHVPHTPLGNASAYLLVEWVHRLALFARTLAAQSVPVETQACATVSSSHIPKLPMYTPEPLPIDLLYHVLDANQTILRDLALWGLVAPAHPC